MPSLRGSLGRSRSSRDAAGAGKQRQHRKKLVRPPLKRRRLVSQSSTATSDDDDASSSSLSSDEPENDADEDYREETTTATEAESEDAHRKSSSTRHSRSYSQASSGSEASSDASSPKPLKPIEVNSPARSRSSRRRSKDSKGKKVSNRLKREISGATTRPNFAISPVKLRPSAPAQVSPSKRGFFVRPDQANFAISSYPPTASPSRTSSSQDTRQGFQTGFRKFAGRMMQRVNRIGISGNAKQGLSASASLPNISELSSSLTGSKRKREHATIADPQELHSWRSRSQKGQLQEAPTAPALNLSEFGAIQPIRRTRSIVKKMEAIGVPVSHAESSGQRSAENEDDETESVSRSIAEMSLDEISEHVDEDDTDSNLEGPDDAWCLEEATATQLHRLRKDRLLALTSTLRKNRRQVSTIDTTKDVLVQQIIDARVRTLSRTVTVSSSSPSSAEDDDEVEETPQVTRTYTSKPTRRLSGVSAGKSASWRSGRSSAESSPRAIRANARSRSSYALATESSAGENDDDDDDKPLRRRSSTRRTGSLTASLNLCGLADKTPGRLRSGKLRRSGTTTSVVSSSDIEPDSRFAGSPKRPGDDLPTPIARRTRHGRNPSMVSVSSAGFGDDEQGDLANGEYRLRRVSVQRRSKPERRRSARSSEDDQFDELEDGDKTIGAIEHDSVDEEEDGLNHDEDFDFSSATVNTLLRLRRDDLVRLCRDRDVAAEGTKRDLAVALLDWYRSQQNDDEKVDATSSSSSSDDQDEAELDPDEDDEDYEPPADISMASNTSIEESDEDEPGSSPAKSNTSRTTARQSDQRARDETKTQAMACLTNKRHSFDSKSQGTPLLMQDQSELVHSAKVNTPPGSGDQQDNDLELDLESLNLVDKEIAPDKLKRGEKIGSGGFKDVYEGRYRNVKVALADIRGHLTENDIKELGLLRDLRHENIVRFIGVSIPDAKDVPVTIVTELCANGDLFDYIRNVPPPSFEKILSIMLNIARGVDYLHKRKPAIVHRDLKSSNVLITSKGVAKIADFGLARVRNSTRSIIKSLVGTVNWQAPELWVAHPRYNEKADVYSAALVFWECLQWHLSQKRYPFEGMNEHAIYQEVGGKQNRPPTATMRRQWGGDILDLVERMWAQDPKERPTMGDVVRDLETLIQQEKARNKASRHH